MTQGPKQKIDREGMKQKERSQRPEDFHPSLINTHVRVFPPQEFVTPTAHISPFFCLFFFFWPLFPAFFVPIYIPNFFHLSRSSLT